MAQIWNAIENDPILLISLITLMGALGAFVNHLFVTQVLKSEPQTTLIVAMFFGCFAAFFYALLDLADAIEIQLIEGIVAGIAAIQVISEIRKRVTLEDNITENIGKSTEIAQQLDEEKFRNQQLRTILKNLEYPFTDEEIDGILRDSGEES